MFSQLGTVLLVIFIITRPFELLPALRGIPVLYGACGFAMFGLILDVRTGLLRMRSTVIVKQAIIWILWVLVATAIIAPSTIVASLTKLLILFVVFYLTATSVQSRAALDRVLGTVVLCALWINLLCFHQSLQPLECVVPSQDWEGDEEPLGMECEHRNECGAEDAECSKVGWFGVTSIGPRIRYTGILKDPNEMAMLAASIIPLAFGWLRSNPNTFRLAVFSINVILGIANVLSSQSRGGLLVLGLIGLTILIKRYGLTKALAIALPVASIFLALAGSSMEREDAKESSEKRLGCMLSGINMLLRSPIFGVGLSQFTQYHDQTAHNAYILVAAESGLVALVLAGLVGYKAFQSANFVERNAPRPEHRLLGACLKTSLLGMFSGSFFLSFAYNGVLWIFLALPSALLLCTTKTETPALRVTSRDVLLALAGSVALLGAIYVYTTIKIG